MTSSQARIRLLATVSALICAGCVVVNPSNVSVSAFDSGPSNAPPATPYASALQTVTKQQSAVRAEVDAQDWAEANDEIDDWVTDTRKLMGYADTSHDPGRFRAYGNELLTAIERLRQAVARHDARASRTALSACDPVLNKFSRDFPLTEPAGQPPPASSHPPARTPPPQAP